METVAETPFADDPMEFDVSDQEGMKIAANPVLSIAVLPDGESKIFKRRAIKGVGGGSPAYTSTLVAELNGVRCYIAPDGKIVMTSQDLYL